MVLSFLLSEKIENKKPSTEHNLKANAIFLSPNKKMEIIPSNRIQQQYPQNQKPEVHKHNNHIHELGLSPGNRDGKYMWIVLMIAEKTWSYM